MKWRDETLTIFVCMIRVKIVYLCLHCLWLRSLPLGLGSIKWCLALALAWHSRRVSFVLLRYPGIIWVRAGLKTGPGRVFWKAFLMFLETVGLSSGRLHRSRMMVMLVVRVDGLIASL